jgi:hypothetical protein
MVWHSLINDHSAKAMAAAAVAAGKQTHLLPTLLLLFVRRIIGDADDVRLPNCGLSMLYCYVVPRADSQKGLHVACPVNLNADDKRASFGVKRALSQRS